MIRIVTIAINTFTEVIRQPIYLIIVGCSLFLILCSPYFTMFAMLANNKMIKDMGLSTILLTGLLLAAFSAPSVIYHELENKTILTILSKPVSRASFILGKYLGLVLGLLVAEYLLSLVLTQVVRTEITEAAYSHTDRPVFIGYLLATLFTLGLGAFANFFYEKPFTASAIVFAVPVFSLVFLALCLVRHDWQLEPFGKPPDLSLFLATLLIFFATCILTAIATAASTRMGPVPTFAICTILFLCGLFSDYAFGNMGQSSWTEALAHLWAGYFYPFIGKLCYTIIPNLQIYWVADAVVEGRRIPWTAIQYMVIYTIFWLTAILALAIAVFQDQEAQ